MLQILTRQRIKKQKLTSNSISKIEQEWKNERIEIQPEDKEVICEEDVDPSDHSDNIQTGQLGQERDTSDQRQKN